MNTDLIKKWTVFSVTTFDGIKYIGSWPYSERAKALNVVSRLNAVNPESRPFILETLGAAGK